MRCEVQNLNDTITHMVRKRKQQSRTLTTLDRSLPAVLFILPFSLPFSTFELLRSGPVRLISRTRIPRVHNRWFGVWSLQIFLKQSVFFRIAIRKFLLVFLQNRKTSRIRCLHYWTINLLAVHQKKKNRDPGSERSLRDLQNVITIRDRPLFQHQMGPYWWDSNSANSITNLRYKRQASSQFARSRYRNTKKARITGER